MGAMASVLKPFEYCPNSLANLPPSTRRVQDGRESAIRRSRARPLLGHRHIELGIREATLAKEVVAHQIRPPRDQKLSDLGVKLTGISLVTEFVHGLVGNHRIEVSEASRPSRLRETALNKNVRPPRVDRASPERGRASALRNPGV